MKTIILSTLMFVVGFQVLIAQDASYRGTVVDTETRLPLENATVQLKRNNTAVRVDERGDFEITGNVNDSLQISSIGYMPVMITIKDLINEATIGLTRISYDLEEVTVINTGYQQLPKERATGSFQQIGSELFNRSVSTNILSRLENVVSGLMFNKGDAA